MLEYLKMMVYTCSNHEIPSKHIEKDTILTFFETFTNGITVLSLSIVCKSQPTVCLAIVRVNFDGFKAIFNSFIELAHLSISSCPEKFKSGKCMKQFSYDVLIMYKISIHYKYKI